MTSTDDGDATASFMPQAPASDIEAPPEVAERSAAPRYRPVGAPYQVPARPPASPPADVRRRVYRAASPTPPVSADAAQHSSLVRWGVPASRLVVSLPLAYTAAAAAGAALWLWHLAGVGSPDEPAPGLLAAAGCGAALVAASASLALAVLLREQPRRPVWRWSAIVSGVATAGAAGAAAGGVSPMPTLAAAGVLAYATVISLLCGGIRAWGLDTGPLSSPRSVRPLDLLWRIPLAIAGALGAAGAGFLVFSLAVASSLPAQREFALGETLWERATAGGGAALVAHVLALLAVHAAAAALFGLLAHGTVRALGWWRGRLHVWWCVLAAITVVVGLAAWLLDGSLPR